MLTGWDENAKTTGGHTGVGQNLAQSSKYFNLLKSNYVFL